MSTDIFMLNYPENVRDAMMVYHIRRTLKGLKIFETEKLDQGVRDIISAMSFIPFHSYTLIRYCAISDDTDYELIGKYKTFEEAKTEYDRQMKYDFRCEDDMKFKIINNETGQEFVDNIWYE